MKEDRDIFIDEHEYIKEKEDLVKSNNFPLSS